jgi:hypothetical protein
MAGACPPAGPRPAVPPQGGMKLQASLRQQPAQGVADQHRRLGEPGRRPLHVVQVVADAVPDPPRRPVVAAQLHGLDRWPRLVSRLAKPSQHQGPWPRHG